MALHALARRVADATPPDRDRAVDGLRALAIGGVVLGHWLVTALVTDGGVVRGASPLRFLPALTPVSWLFQTLAVFFLVGGYTAGRPRTVLLGGGAATVVLIRWFGYPASMVGVPGGGISNLNPPTLAVVTFGLAQCGLALLLLGPLRALLRHPVAWAGVALLNLSAMTVFLWHQTAMIAVTFLVDGTRPGLHTVPDTQGWMVARVLWLPAFAVVLASCWAVFHRFERGHPNAATPNAAR